MKTLEFRGLRSILTPVVFVATALSAAEKNSGGQHAPLYPSLDQAELQQPYRSHYQWRPEDGIPQQQFIPAASQPMPCPQPPHNPYHYGYPVSPNCIEQGPASAPMNYYSMPQGTPPTPDSGLSCFSGYPHPVPAETRKGHIRQRSGSLPSLTHLSLGAAEETDTDEVETATNTKYSSVSADRALEILQETEQACLAALASLTQVVKYQTEAKRVLWEAAIKRAKTQSPTSRHSSLSRVFDLVKTKEQKAKEVQVQKLDHYTREMEPTKNAVLQTAALFDVIKNVAEKYQAKLSDDPLAFTKQS